MNKHGALLKEKCYLCPIIILECVFMIGTPEIILIALVVLLLFGGKKIPELMRGLGKGVKSFKDGMNGRDDPSDSEPSATDNDKK